MAVDPAVKIALFNELPKQLPRAFLAGPDNGTPYRNTVSLHPPEDVVNDLLHGSTGDFLAARRTVRLADSGPQQSEVVLNFSHRRNR